MTTADVVFVLGVMFIVAGLAWIYPPVGLIAFGLFLAANVVLAPKKNKDKQN